MEESAMALGSTSLGTRLGASADSAGPLNALAMPSRTATENSTGRLIASAQVKAASTLAHTIWSPMVARATLRSEEHTSELQSLMRISYAVFCLKKKKTQHISP